MQDLEFRMVQGEDWACYVEWVDDNGEPIASSDEALAMMQVRQTYGGEILLEFVAAAPPDVAPAAHVLGQSGITRLTCPRSFSAGMAPGRYYSDLFIKHTDEKHTVFTGGTQHHRMLDAWFIVEPRVTVASMPGGEYPGTGFGVWKGTIGDGVNTVYTCVHNLGTNDIEVVVYSALDGSGADVEHQRVSLNEIELRFNHPPDTDSFRVIITER